MERRGADKYPTAFLQKTFKELESKGTTVIDSAGAGTGTGTAEGEGEGEGEGVKEEEGEGEGGA